MFWLVGYVWLFTGCWLAGQAIRWLIKGGARRFTGWARYTFADLREQGLRRVTGRPEPWRVRARIADLERDLRVGTYQVDERFGIAKIDQRAMFEDGQVFGRPDRQVIKAIQREAGLVVDGVLGPITQSKINEGDRS
jgi:hypothetical protein